MTNKLWFNLIVGFKFYFHLFQTHYHTLPYLKNKVKIELQQIYLSGAYYP